MAPYVQRLQPIVAVPEALDRFRSSGFRRISRHAAVAPFTMQANPAQPIARCGVQLGLDQPVQEFYRQLAPIERASGRRSARGA
jgi:hypothetical protein